MKNISERGKKELADLPWLAKKIIEQMAKKQNEITNNIKEGEKEKNEIDKGGYLSRKSELEDAEMRLHSRTKNPRKVKRYLADIERSLSTVDVLWFQNQECTNNEYSSEQWVRTIFQVSFLKAFLTEEYDKIIMAGDLKTFKEAGIGTCIVDILLDVFDSWIFSGESPGASVLNLVIFRLYALDINTNKSKHQKLMEEIDTDDLKEESL